MEYSTRFVRCQCYCCTTAVFQFRNVVAFTQQNHIHMYTMQSHEPVDIAQISKQMYNIHCTMVTYGAFAIGTMTVMLAWIFELFYSLQFASLIFTSCEYGKELAFLRLQPMILRGKYSIWSSNFIFFVQLFLFNLQWKFLVRENSKAVKKMYCWFYLNCFFFGLLVMAAYT